jgi:type IV pilus assembly protein PilA
MQEENEGGFTLIELLVVIIIIGILAAIAIPVFLSQRKKGYDAGIKSDLRNAATAEESYLTDDPSSYTLTGSDLDNNGLKLSSSGDYQGGTQQLLVAIDANKGYCIVGSSASDNAFLYDSQGGGLNSTTFNSGTGATAAATNLTAAEGACSITPAPAAWTAIS